ncbi:lytic transglycosylase domain-containing protein [Crossiella cryophila]|uniref:Membrane-bound lytic murein transglycosylase B n=1 Tax=Crossiella cryophila TaxID=43355 RepID=A0A7W7FQH8_9PSEU|nr:lytic murein transglycosylase [Crossiella cryophila]MBB4674167.1 membrane-bound lytic murein transglycosylase B [Crossiella cryophila]
MVTPAAPSLPTPTPEPPRRRAGLAGRLVIAGVVVGVAGAGIWALTQVTEPDRTPRRVEPPIVAVPVEPGSAVPGDVLPDRQPPPDRKPPPAAQGGQAPDPIGEWANRVSETIEVPARALRAYAVADLTLRAEKPRCRITWATIAAIGRIESNHNRYGGATLQEDGRPSKPIIGVPLDGSPGFKAIPDTDKGQLDGDTQWDRAVGPMQFIPGTWKRFAADGDGDGKADPQDIDDAAVAAGRYLCSANRDMGTGKDWWAATFTYNNSVEYGQKVFGLADRYARGSLGQR